MAGNRRDFIKGTASIGLLGVSEASAKTYPVKRSYKGRTKPKLTTTEDRIGVISSITFNGALRQAFETGLTAQLNDSNIFENKGYDDLNLGPAIGTLNGIPNLKLIVTVGGAITESAAERLGAIDYISLTGGTFGLLPGQPGGNFKGGASLESFLTNRGRIKHQTETFNIQPANIGLLYNTNSLMTPVETSSWSMSNRFPVTVDPSMTDATIGAAFSNIFTTIGG